MAAEHAMESIRPAERRHEPQRHQHNAGGNGTPAPDARVNELAGDSQ